MTRLLKQAQIEFEDQYSKKNTIPRLKQEFTDQGIYDFMAEVDYPEPDFGLMVVVQMWLHKRADLNTLVGSLVGTLESIFEKRGETLENPLQDCADLLDLAVEVDLLDYYPDIAQFVTIYDVSPEVAEEMKLFQYPLPHVCEPAPVKHNGENGFYKTRGSILLSGHNHNDDVALDHINRMNKNRYAVDMDVVAFTTNEWKGVNERKPTDTIQEFEKRKKNFKRYNDTAHDVLQALHVVSDAFYLTHRYDFRGRTYAQGHHVTPQGNSWNKACLESAHQEIVEG